MIRAILLFAVCGALAAQDTQASAALQSHLAQYRKLRQKAASGVPKLKPKSSPQAIENNQRMLAHKIQEAREHEPQGNIFTPPIAAEFKRLIAETMKGPDAVTIRQSLARGEPVKLNLEANHEYPKGIPLQTTPPSLLRNLPKLPEGYEYRVVNHSLLLLDVGANLIVDLIPNVIP